MAGLTYPYDWGFVPSTKADDGDPLDVMVLMDEPAHVGCLVDGRIIGVIEAKQKQDVKTERNDCDYALLRGKRGSTQFRYPSDRAITPLFRHAAKMPRTRWRA